MADSDKQTKKTWKDHLLSSGLPLEHSVRSLLKRHGMDSIEYLYERTDHQGVARVFSVDLCAVYMATYEHILVELFVECKYRHDSVRWVFAPDHCTLWFESDFVILDQFITGDELCGLPDPDDPYVGLPFLSEDHLCSTGVEIIGNNADRAGIREGLQQLRYALINQAATFIAGQVESFGELYDKPIVLVPLLVTTAQLWRMSDSATLEQIRDATSIEEVAFRHSILICRQEPNAQEARHAGRSLATALSKLTTEQKQAICEAIGKKESYCDRFPCFHEYDLQPSLFIIVEYGALETHLERLLRFFDEIAALRSGAGPARQEAKP